MPNLIHSGDSALAVRDAYGSKLLDGLVRFWPTKCVENTGAVAAGSLAAARAAKLNGGVGTYQRSTDEPTAVQKMQQPDGVVAFELRFDGGTVSEPERVQDQRGEGG